MSFIKVASKNELGEGEMKAVTVDSKQILIVNLGGEFFAIGNVCKHMSCPLSAGVLNDDAVECPCHGSLYKVRTGEVVRGPSTESEPSYQVKVEGDQVFVKL